MKEYLKPCAYKQSKPVKGWWRTFCGTVRRVIVTGEVKVLSTEAEGKPSVKSAFKSVAIDPKPGDLAMTRLKWR